MSAHKRILGIDFGTKRIGIAVSDPLRIIATGVTVVMNSPDMFAEIKRLADEYEVQTIVVGMPLTLKGERGIKALEVEDFIHTLQARTNCEVVAWDERFSSQTVHEPMRTMGVKKKKRQSKAQVDLMASAVILQGYLDAVKS